MARVSKLATEIGAANLNMVRDEGMSFGRCLGRHVRISHEEGRTHGIDRTERRSNEYGSDAGH
jgi:hypothetical protein